MKIKSIAQFFHGSFFWGLEFLNCTFNYCLIPLLRYKLYLINSKDILNGPDIRRYCKRTFANFNIKLTISNPHNIDLTKQFIFISNHSSWFDQPTLKFAVDNPTHFLAKEDYLKIPVLCWGLQIHQTIFVSKKSNKKVNDLCQKYLREGHSLCIYPEATRSLGEEIRPFKSGAFYHSSSSRVQILPVYIENTNQILIKSDPLWKINRGVKVTLHIGQPFSVAPGQEETLKKEMELKYCDFFQRLKAIQLTATNW